MDSKFLILCFSLTLSVLIIPSSATLAPSSDDGPPPAPSPLPPWKPLPAIPIPPTKNVTQQDIDSICSSSQDPKFCHDIIASIPVTSRPNLKQLQTSVINQATAIINATLAQFPGLIGSIKEPELKDAHVMCQQHYYNTREEFMDGISLMNKKSFYLPVYRTVIDLMKNVIVELEACEIDVPVNPFTEEKNKLTSFAHLVSAIGKYLYETLEKSFSA